MRKIIILIALLFITLFMVMPGSAEGSYNTITRQIRCNSEYTCLHEIGHKVDQEGGFISRTDEFKNAVEVYRMTVTYTNGEQWIVDFPGIGAPRVECKAGIFSSCFFTGWGGYAELYAEMLARGVPDYFRGFYNWERIEILKVKHGL